MQYISAAHFAKALICTRTNSRRAVARRALKNFFFYRFKPLQSRNIQERDSREVQDQTVEVNSGNTGLERKVSVPVYSERKVLDIYGQIQLLKCHIRVIGC